MNSSGTFGGPFGYAGKFGYDSGEGSLLLVGNRWYDPEVGRFLSRDPAHDGQNWYAYCANNPLKYVDPTGLEWHDPGIVYVDPNFRGTVIVVGEQEGDGDAQVSVELKPGQHSNPHMDVDVIIVITEDGKITFYAFVGWRHKYQPGDSPQLATVSATGQVSGPNVHSDNWLSERFVDNMKKNLDPKRLVRYPPRSGRPPLSRYKDWFDKVK